MNTLDIHRGQRLGFRCFQAGVLFLQLGQDARQLQTAIADGRIHFIHRVTVVAARQVGHELVILLRRDHHQVAAQLFFKGILALGNVFVPALFLEPVADLVLCFAGFYNVQPVAGGTTVFRAGDDFNDFAGNDLMVNGHNAVVYLGADHPVSHGGMDGVSKVDDGCAGRQVDHIAAWGKGKHFFRQQVRLDIAEQVGGINAGTLAFQQLAHPSQAFVQPITAGGGNAGLILPVGSNAVFRVAVHLAGTDLHLKGDGFAANHGGVQALVAVGFGGGDIILEAVGQRVVHIMDQAQRGITFRHRINNDADSINIINLLKVLVLHIHLAVNAVDALDTVADGCSVDAVLFQVFLDGGADIVEEVIPMLVQQGADHVIAHRIQVLQAAVLQLLLDVGNAKAVGNGGINLHGFQGFIAAFLLRPGIAGTHIVQAVTQLYDHHADILAHGKQHFAQVFRFAVLDIRELDLGQLGNTIHQQGNLAAKLLADLVNGHGGILGHIVHQGCGNAFAIHAKFHQQLCHADWVADIRFAAAAELGGMRRAGQLISTVNHVKIIGTAAGDQIMAQCFISSGHGHRLLLRLSCLFCSILFDFFWHSIIPISSIAQS